MFKKANTKHYLSRSRLQCGCCGLFSISGDFVNLLLSSVLLPTSESSIGTRLSEYNQQSSSPITTRIRFYEFVVLCFMNCCDLVFMLGHLLELVFCVIRLPLESLKNTESTRGEIALDCTTRWKFR